MEDLMDLILQFTHNLPLDDDNRPTFKEINHLTSQMHLGYQRHVKIRSLVEQAAIRFRYFCM